jgi:leucyl-tRNA synthetase
LARGSKNGIFLEIDRNWQTYWEKTGINHFNPKICQKTVCPGDVLPDPAGGELHVGHWYNYSRADSWARMKKMQGYEVFQPMGLIVRPSGRKLRDPDRIQPQGQHLSNIRTMKKQLREMGAHLTGTPNWPPATRPTIAGTSGCS